MRSRKLSIYRKKRDFEKTAEPSGEAKVAPSKRRRFVIQKHAATRLHYDLRLEFDGVFKSWAVTRAPRSIRTTSAWRWRSRTIRSTTAISKAPSQGPIWRRHGAAVGPRLLGSRTIPSDGYKKGDLKFTLDGERLHGSWVLVRMKHDRTGGKRTNWLLIKHRDEFAREGEADEILDEDRSVASGRSHGADRRGQGRAPKPFMTGEGRRGKADAVWHSNRGEAAEARATPKQGRQRQKPCAHRRKKVAAMPDFVAPQLCTLGRSAAGGRAGCHEIKFDGYRMQLRVEDGEATLKTRKGLDWTDKFPAIAKEAGALPDVLIDGEIVALDHTARRILRPCRRRFPTARPTSWSSSPSTCCSLTARTCAACRSRERKARLKQLLEHRRTARTQLIRYVEHFEADGDEVLHSALQAVAGRHRLEKARARLIIPAASDSWTKAKCRAGHEVVIGGWKTTDGKFRSLLAASIAAIISPMSASSAPASARTTCGASCRR